MSHWNCNDVYYSQKLIIQTKRKCTDIVFNASQVQAFDYQELPEQTLSNYYYKLHRNTKLTFGPRLSKDKWCTGS